MAVNVLLQDQPWRMILINGYSNATQRKSLLCQAKIHANTRFNVILLGNFNCVLNKKERILSTNIIDPSAEVLRWLIRDWNLIDCATNHALCFTHFQGSSRSRLDWIYISASVSTALSNYSVIPVFFSDDCMVPSSCRYKNTPGKTENHSFGHFGKRMKGSLKMTI